MKDTVPNFPEIPELAPGQRDHSSESSQTTHPFASSGQETAPMKLGRGRQARPLLIFHPLVVLVLFPISLVGLVMLIWWLLQLL